MLPYPWGYTRDETVCNIDHHNLAYDRDAVTGNDREAADAEVERVSQARPSGAYARCVSPYGVRDMNGNVVDQDVATDNFPVLGLNRQLCPTWTGTFQVEIIMYSGGGDVGVQAFATN